MVLDGRGFLLAAFSSAFFDFGAGGGDPLVFVAGGEFFFFVGELGGGFVAPFGDCLAFFFAVEEGLFRGGGGGGALRGLMEEWRRGR